MLHTLCSLWNHRSNLHLYIAVYFIRLYLRSCQERVYIGWLGGYFSSPTDQQSGSSRSGEHHTSAPPPGTAQYSASMQNPSLWFLSSWRSLAPVCWSVCKEGAQTLDTPLCFFFSCYCSLVRMLVFEVESLWQTMQNICIYRPKAFIWCQNDFCTDLITYV